MFDVHGKLAIEHGKKVVYAKCKLALEQQQPSPIPTSPSQSEVNRPPVRITARLEVPEPDKGKKR